MSASDAAPLPRLGEVFFDVRGNSRSMRLSWYADTDVAVFSIWQGGVCTGTFRLPMGDLSRMIEILQRGPDKRHAWSSERRGGATRGVSDRETNGRGTSERESRERGGPGRTDSGYDADYEAHYNGEYDADYTVAHSASAGNGPANEPDYGPDKYGPGSANGPSRYGAAGEYGSGDYISGSGDYRPGEHRSGDYAPGDYGAGDYGAGDYSSGDYSSGDYSSGDYSSGEYGPGGYGESSHGEPGHGDTGYRDGGSRAGGHRAGGHRAEGYGPDDYGQPDFEQAAHAPRPTYWHEDDRYQADVTGQRSVQADEAYGQQRFVPPYVHPQPDSAEPGYLDESEYRLPADPPARSRHSAGGYGRGRER